MDIPDVLDIPYQSYPPDRLRTDFYTRKPICPKSGGNSGIK